MLYVTVFAKFWMYSISEVSPFFVDYPTQVFDNMAKYFMKADYCLVQKSTYDFVFRPKMAIFRRAGMREGELPLPLAFQYLILMI